MLKSTKDHIGPSTLNLMARLRSEMRRDPFGFEREFVSSAAKDAIWVMIVTLSSIAFSFAFACVTPFAALGALAGTQMKQRPGLALVVAAWTSNQLIGYFLLSYPRTWDSFGWGAAIGIAALLTTIAARRAATIAHYPLAAALFAFATAFAVYEGALFAATAILPASAAAFSLPIVARILTINLSAFVGLLVIQRLAIWFGLQQQTHSLHPVLD
jgi:hypothetical protein